MSATSFRRKQGFTLIELLVVVSIISLLAAILFPVFARARENARRAACQSNLKQIGLAMIMYSQDYDDRVVPEYLTVDGTAGGTPTGSWYNFLEPYLKNTQIFICPSRPTAQIPSFGSDNTIARNFKFRTYAAFGAIPLARLTRSSELMIVGDAENVAASGLAKPGWSTYGVPWLYPRCDYAFNTFAIRHFDGGNVLFFDGHVKWMLNRTVNTNTGDLWGCSANNL